MSEKTIARIDARLADLREANETYRKASWDRSDAIQRNDREIRWLLDTKSELFLERRSAAAADVIERVAAHKAADPATDDLTVSLAIELAEARIRRDRAESAIRNYLATFDRCGGSEAVSAEEFADRRQGMRDVLTEGKEA